jgi:hypothetical protein
LRDSLRGAKFTRLFLNHEQFLESKIPSNQRKKEIKNTSKMADSGTISHAPLMGTVFALLYSN